MTCDWEKADGLVQTILEEWQTLDAGQKASLRWLWKRFHDDEAPGLVLADEVGRGKTRVACALVQAVVAAGGRVVVVVPAGIIHQWKKEAKDLIPPTSSIARDVPPAKTLVTFRELLAAAGDAGEAMATMFPSDEPEWWLISQRFSPPRVRAGARYWWSIALPSLASAYLFRDKYGAKALRELPESDGAWVGWRALERIAQRAAERADRRLRDDLEEQKILTEKTKPGIIESMKSREPGSARDVYERLLGAWLGDFDLIVIDEAHKSRSDVEGEGKATKVLPRLLDNILREKKGAHRLALTATPMELGPEQWLHLLRRVDRKGDFEAVKGAVALFAEAVEAAASAPDELHALTHLEAASKSMESALAPFVTRRRAQDEKLLVDFRRRLVETPGDVVVHSAHAHRRVTDVALTVSAAASGGRWADVLFGVQCLARASRGLPREATELWPSTVRDAYTRLAAGHAADDLFDASDRIRVPAHGEGLDVWRNKIRRCAYWLDFIHAALRDMSATGCDPDFEHPRLLGGVDEIERWTASGQKVLVFGVFVRPLQHLRDALNVREALRRADRGAPVAHKVTDRLLPVAMRELDRMRARCDQLIALRDAGAVELRRALDDAHERHAKLVDSARRSAHEVIVRWVDDGSFLGLSARVAAELAASDDRGPSFARELREDLARTMVEEGDIGIAEDYFRSHLAPLLEEHTDEDAGAEADDDDVERSGPLVEVFEQTGARRQYAELMGGDTRPNTRRYIQSAFNRRGAWPNVLIAQSQVGREGLNLHEQCRVVVQYHPEWNPAVVEQQIGRVDRKGSLWEQLATEWLESAPGVTEPPFIEVRNLVFQGTYDAFQWATVKARHGQLDASLFGSLLPPAAWERVPDEWKARLRAAAPAFTPPE